MLKNKVIKNILLTALGIYFLVIISLAIVAIWDYSILLGWIIGGITTILSFLIGSFLISKIKLKNFTYWGSFWMAILRTALQMIFHLIVFFIILAINTNVHNVSYLFGGVEVLYSPINIISYLSSLILITMSSLINILWTRKK